MSNPLRPPGFNWKTVRGNQNLHCENLPAATLAGRFGTPLYVYSSAMLRSRYEMWEQAFQKCAHTICYSVKANPNISILRLLAGMGAGFDVVSGGELQRVILAAKNAAASTVFSGVGKTKDEIELAIASNIF